VGKGGGQKDDNKGGRETKINSPHPSYFILHPYGKARIKLEPLLD
jgi:hypothetical protein